MVRIASISNVSIRKVRMHPDEDFDDRDRLLDTSGGDVPEEFDENGDPVRYKHEVQLKKMAGSGASNPASFRGVNEQDPPPMLFDISKLKLEKFHKVIHHLVFNCKDRQPVYVQPASADLSVCGAAAQ